MEPASKRRLRGATPKVSYCRNSAAEAHRKNLTSGGYVCSHFVHVEHCGQAGDSDEFDVLLADLDARLDEGAEAEGFADLPTLRRWPSA
jgi:hypothetical protein